MNDCRLSNMIRIICFLGSIFLLVSGPGYSQSSGYEEDSIFIESEGANIYGSLIIPDNRTSETVTLIIPGSGPTDRNGNNPMMTNNSLRMLAEGMAEYGISSLRFDKRGVGESYEAVVSEEDLTFENYVDDAITWLSILKKDERFRKVVVIGHSEGSLIGMIAASKIRVNGFISIAGPGQPADQILKRQLNSQPQFVKAQVFPMIDSLKSGWKLNQVDPAYYALFRPSVQPYMISWFKYDPATEIAKLDIPVLIIQGSTDIQVNTSDAELLHDALPGSTMEIIEGMNHIFKPASLDRQENLNTYSDPDLPVKQELIQIVAAFIKDLE